MRDNFHIFLDIDGVMFDLKYILSNRKKIGGIIDNFNPESVKALNYLCNVLSTKFETNLVVTSTWKHSWDKLLNTFDKYGVDISNVKLDSTVTRYNPKFRGREVFEYLGDSYAKGNFVIIDDELFDYYDYFDKSNIIKTNFYNNSLNISMVKEFFNSKGINCNIEETPIK